MPKTYPKKPYFCAYFSLKNQYLCMEKSEFFFAVSDAAVENIVFLIIALVICALLFLYFLFKKIVPQDFEKEAEDFLKNEKTNQPNNNSHTKL